MIRWKTICVGTACNNSCLCCENQGSGPMNISIEDIRHQVDETGDCENITIGGYEPTISANLFEAIAYCRKLGKKRIKLLTNGRMLSYKGFAEKLVSSGITHLEMELFGSNPATHDLITRRNQSFSQALSGLANARKAGDNFTTESGRSQRLFIGARIILCRQNSRELIEIISLLSDKGVDQMVIRIPASEKSDLHSYVEEIRNAIDRCMDLGIWAYTSNVPFCLMQGCECHVQEAYEAPGGPYNVESHPRCVTCVYSGFCPRIGSQAEIPSVVALNEDMLRLRNAQD